MTTEYNLHSLIEDYRRILQIHCNNNNIFEVRMFHLEISDMMMSTKCKQINCKCIANIKQMPFKLDTLSVLSLIHCFLYHGYCNDDSNVQRLRDCIMDKNELILKYEANHLSQLLSDQLIKERHGSINSVISNLSRRSTSKSTVSRLSSLSDNNQRNESEEDKMKKLIIGSQPHNIEMSQNRVRKLSGQINENELKQMLNEYDDDGDEALDDGLISHSEESSLNETDRAEIESFKLKMDCNVNGSNNERRGSKHNLFQEQQGDEWNVDEMNQTVQDMKKQLFHLALSSQ